MGISSSGKDPVLLNLYVKKYFLIRKVGGGPTTVGIENLMLKNLFSGMRGVKKGKSYLREGINLEVKQ